MARFIVIHNVTVEEMSQDQLVDLAKQVAARLKPGVEWISSWYASEANKLFCDWEAPDEGVIRAALGEALKVYPIEVIHSVIYVNPAWYAEQF
jgi:hypothetical protein